MTNYSKLFLTTLLIFCSANILATKRLDLTQLQYKGIEALGKLTSQHKKIQKRFQPFFEVITNGVPTKEKSKQLKKLIARFSNAHYKYIDVNQQINDAITVLKDLKRNVKNLLLKIDACLDTYHITALQQGNPQDFSVAFNFNYHQKRAIKQTIQALRDLSTYIQQTKHYKKEAFTAVA